MQHENTLNSHAKMNQMPEKLSQIEDAKTRVSSERIIAEERLQKLREKYPRLLARKALEQATDGEIIGIKRDIMDLEALLADFPLTLQGLDELERSIRNGILEDKNEVESLLIATIEEAV
jgi:hypothetical protein